LGGADIGHDGDTHSGESGDETTGSPDKKADACRKIFEVADCGKKKEGDARNGLQLTIEVSGGTFLDRGGDLPHAIVAIGLPFNPDDKTPCGG